MKGKNASKDKKKAPSENVNKTVSDYQAGKSTVSKADSIIFTKKK